MEIIKNQVNIFELVNTDFSLVFGHLGMALVPALHEFGIDDDPFILPQPVIWPNHPNRWIRFINLDACDDEEIRTIFFNWLQEAQAAGKKHLATNGLNNIMQPGHNIHPEFKMRQFERARLLESLILSWCKFNQNNFETITLISMDPDFLDI